MRITTILRQIALPGRPYFSHLLNRDNAKLLDGRVPTIKALCHDTLKIISVFESYMPLTSVTFYSPCQTYLHLGILR